MVGKKSATALGTLALALTLSFGVASVQAAVCKGLEKGVCERNESCSWVNPYVRKDGVKVTGYCKSKPHKSSKSSKSGKDKTPKKDKEKDTKKKPESKQ